MKQEIIPTLLFLTITTTTELVEGHGLLTLPSSKNGGTLSVPHASSNAHFTLGSYGIIDKAFFDGDHSKTPWTKPGEFDHQLATDLIPGHPQTMHPCGCNAGDVAQCAGVVHASGFGETILGTMVTPPTWEKGSVQETAWNAWVNHAGGHIYMLCKKTEFDSCRDIFLPPDQAQATQEERGSYLDCVWGCFESNTLEWAPLEDGTWSQKIQFQDDHCTYAAMDPMEKVGKDNHLWRFTPIPDSLQVSLGGEGKCMWDSVTSFSNVKARNEFIASFGNEDVCDWGVDCHAPSNWHVFDKVVVPTDLEEGEYLLSWRWDGYMADQMWTNCADVTIATSEDTATSSNSDLEDECPSMAPTIATSNPVSSPTHCPAGYSGRLPHDDCTKHYYCQNGAMVGEVSDCPVGTLFHLNLQYCNWAQDVICDSSIVSNPPVVECPSGYTGLHPYDQCTKYYNCLNGEVVGGVSECPTGTLFDMGFQYCNWANDMICELL